jgi:hypothetical protein
MKNLFLTTITITFIFFSSTSVEKKFFLGKNENFTQKINFLIGKERGSGRDTEKSVYFLKNTIPKSLTYLI